MGNGFDKIAKKAEPGKGKKATKIAAEVTKDVREAVDRIITIKAQIRDLENEQASKELQVIDHITPQQEALAREGNFSKSFDVAGNVGSLTATFADSFSVPQDDESQAALKGLLGPRYKDFLEKRREVKLKENVLKDEELTGKIIAAIEKAGIEVGEIFDVTDKVVTKPDVDRKQFELTPKELGQFRTLVKQKKASLK